MNKIKILDSNFRHTNYSSDFQKCEYFEWDRNFSNYKGELCVVTENFIFNNTFDKNLVGWILEPRIVKNNMYERIKIENTKFYKILTYDKTLLDSDEKFLFYPFGGCWIRPENHQIYKKNKLVSFIGSTKKSQEFSGYTLRNKIIKDTSKKIEKFGRGHNEIKNKLEGLQDFMFSIVIENCSYDNYFTEKLIDCFVTGTIPIYWGCPSIGDFFDINGIITFSDIEELESIIINISEDFYLSKINSIQKNFEEEKKYLLAENWIYKNTNILKND